MNMHLLQLPLLSTFVSVPLVFVHTVSTENSAHLEGTLNHFPKLSSNGLSIGAYCLTNRSLQNFLKSVNSERSYVDLLNALRAFSHSVKCTTR